MFEVNIRFIGGLLAAYYLSGQEVSSCLCLVDECFHDTEMTLSRKYQRSRVENDVSCGCEGLLGGPVF